SLVIQPDNDDDISLRFQRVVRTSYERTGRGVVILIDEYDNPITSAIGKPELQDEFRNILYGFYSSFKSLDQYIHFCMLTGVSKYGQMSVFSGLNNLKDITFLDKFAGICGITEAELHENLQAGVEELAENLNISTEEAYNRLKAHYDGYHFSDSMIDIYNPFSIINALSDSKIQNYWASTGTPTMLIKLLETRDFDLSKLNGAEASLDELGNIYGPRIDPKALFYQTGYLTIKAYDPEYQSYFLGFPNIEVERTFMDKLLETYTEENTNPIAREIPRALRRGDVQSVIDLLKSFLAGIPYDLRKRVAKYENYYHTILYAIFSLIGTEVAAEHHTSR
ncbi:MAG: AAA family ATPase, partial [Muribaculaceae bacterium]|nr:AAA family ATPase [Muribaculaceae bacterium]